LAPPALRVRRAVSWVLGLLALVGVGYGAYELHRFETRPLSLEGLELPAGDPTRFVRGLAATWEDTELTLEAGSVVERASRRALGGRVDPDRVLADVRAARGDAPIWTRVWAWASGAPSDLSFRRETRRDVTRAFVEAMRSRVSLPPVNARRDGTPGRPGLDLHMVHAAVAIEDALTEDRLLVSLPVMTLEPAVRSRGSSIVTRFSEVLSVYETRYTGNGDLSGRAANIELAARLLDGRTFEAGQELSFNEAVGDRTYERGFLPAVELTSQGRRTEGIGGGICQVAATLHAAAFFGGLEIVEHHPHTRFSQYIEHGLDSAVSWPSRDLRVRNSHPFPLRVRATAYGGRLRIALMGAERGPRVEWSTRVLTQVARDTEHAEDSDPTGAAREVLDEGVDGAVIERTRIIHWAEDDVVTEVRHLRYPVVHRLVRAVAEEDEPAAEDEP
jgi:vancomycin resistance protein YoaR